MSHSVTMYACGVHVEAQCRCMRHEKEVIVGRRACPTCIAPAAHSPERVRRTFEVEWDADAGPLWMNTSNLLTCLTAYCPNTRFRARDVTGDGEAITEWQEQGPRNR